MEIGLIFYGWEARKMWNFGDRGFKKMELIRKRPITLGIEK